MPSTVGDEANQSPVHWEDQQSMESTPSRGFAEYTAAMAAEKFAVAVAATSTPTDDVAEGNSDRCMTLVGTELA